MRNAFLDELTSLAEADADVVLITGDLGFGVFEDFERRFPKQYINAGVAEQNMTMVATGMALEGKKVYTYSIGNFPSRAASSKFETISVTTTPTSPLLAWAVVFPMVSSVCRTMPPRT